MNKIKKIILLSALCGALSSPLFFVQAVEDPAPDLGASTPKISPAIDFPKLSVKLPGLNFDKTVCTDTECTNNWLAEYIQALYQYGIGIIGILAVITMMIGGIVWVTAAGNDQRIGEAKKWIGGSLMGVLIAFTSYVVLNMVNPAITVLSPIKLKYIAKIDLEVLDSIEAQTIPTGPNGLISVPDSQYKVPWILQNSAEVGSYDYGYGGTISSSGCGIAALTMVLNYHNININIIQMAEKMKKNGGRVEGGGTSNTKIGEVMREYGLKTERASTFDGAVEMLNKGPVLLSVWDKTPDGDPKTCPFTNRKHYIVFTGYSNGIITVNDPSNKHQNAERMAISLNDIKQKCTFGSGAIVSYK